MVQDHGLRQWLHRVWKLHKVARCDAVSGTWYLVKFWVVVSPNLSWEEEDLLFCFIAHHHSKIYLWDFEIKSSVFVLFVHFRENIVFAYLNQLSELCLDLCTSWCWLTTFPEFSYICYVLLRLFCLFVMLVDSVWLCNFEKRNPWVGPGDWYSMPHCFSLAHLKMMTKKTTIP